MNRPNTLISSQRNDRRVGKSSNFDLRWGFIAWVVIATNPVQAANDPTPPPETLQEFTFREVRMGVVFTLRLYAPDTPRANSAAKAAFDRVGEINNALSDYDPDSELSQLGRKSGPGRPVPVSEDLWTVLVAGQKLSRQSNGAFDVTVGPVVKLWRSARRHRKLPDSAELQNARQLVGFQQIALDTKRQTVELGRSGMQLDFGGIAKGYAGDEMLRVLREHKITRVLIDASGDLVVGDPPPGKTGWRVAIAPLTDANSDQKSELGQSRVLCLRNIAVATSGDAYQFVEINGVRYSHIVNPKTGLGLTHRSTVTVIAPTGMEADSLASALSVLEWDAVWKFVESRENVEAFIARNETRTASETGHVRQQTSSKFSEFLCGSTDR
ncbi:FAD:protein FMN transferase [Thalassoroseus pseudoceratinae]|uniref:FAD:protein FMN transferase n=1 Tax=Thalassoroseus pseudoceratinae TaxID=2713176 RepID=UPI0014239E18|nr:FAD:protein FMN transferase [Thalassoroseus pseudoceratinae]